MIHTIKAIDAHTHINHGSKFDSNPNSNTYNATLAYLQKENRVAGIEKMICSTFSSVLSVEEVEQENEYLQRLCQETPGLYQWVVIDPRNARTFAQADAMLGGDKCVGIKLHPYFHKYTLEEFGDQIFSFAAERNAIVQIHPERAPDYILDFANKYPRVTFIMAHMGSYDEDADARAIGLAKHGNVYVDTSGRASTQNRVVEYTVSKVGSDRILFGTDTYAAGFQRGRIEYALISDEDKCNILRYNAERLFGAAIKA